MEQFTPQFVITNAELLKIIVKYDGTDYLKKAFQDINSRYYIMDVPQRFSFYSMSAHIIYAMHINTFANQLRPIQGPDYGRKRYAEIKKVLEFNVQAKRGEKYELLKLWKKISEYNDLSVLAVSSVISGKIREQRTIFKTFDNNFTNAVNEEYNCFDITKFYK